MTENRTPAGVPTGGQYATTERAAAGVALATTHSEVLAAIAAAKADGKPVRINDHAMPGSYFADGQNYGANFDPGVNSSVCGDYSLGDEPSNRATWATGNDDEPFISVTETAYVIARRDGDDHDLSYDDWTETAARLERAEQADAEADGIYPGIEHLTDNDRARANLDIDRLRRLAAEIREEEGTVRYGVESATEWVAHTEYDDPGGTESRSDYQHEAGDARYFDSLEAAGAVATSRVSNPDWDRDYSPENWK